MTQTMLGSTTTPLYLAVPSAHQWGFQSIEAAIMLSGGPQFLAVAMYTCTQLTHDCCIYNCIILLQCHLITVIICPPHFGVQYTNHLLEHRT